jgi:hypothetical protein
MSYFRNFASWRGKMGSVSAKTLGIALDTLQEVFTK